MRSSLFLAWLTGACWAQDQNPSRQSEFAAVFELVNERRRDAGTAELRPSVVLDQVVRNAARQVTAAGAVDAVDLSGGALGERLLAQGYEHRSLVVAYVTGADPDRLAEQWPDADPTTWDRLLDPALRELAFARGDVQGTSFHLLLAAVSQNDAKADEATGLTDRSAIRRQVLEHTNELRRREGVVPLVADPDLDAVAQTYAHDMLRRGFYGHQSPEGLSAMDRIRAGRITVRLAGENLAEGPPTAALVVKGWNDSPDHRRNLLHTGFRRMGIGVATGPGPDGVYRILWVQLFTSHRRPVL